MKLSIILVNWNTRELTHNTLASVYRETSGIDFEVIVVDNKSADDSVAMIKRDFPQVKLIENTNNDGFAKGNNLGLTIAQGEYLMLLNTDTIVHDKAITKLVSYLDTHTDTMMVGPRLLNGDGTFQHACRRNLPDIWNSFFHLFGFTKLFKNNAAINNYKKYNQDPNTTEPVTALSGAAMLFRRKVYEHTGGLDERFFMYGEDLDFCKQVFDEGWITMYVADAKITHFGGGSSAKRRTKSLVNFYEAMWLYYDKHFRAQYFFIFNWVVWLGIKVRMGVALLQNAMK